MAPSSVHHGELSSLARGGAINLLGSASQALFAFLLLVVLGRGMGAAGAGAFLVAVAVFSVFATISTLGVDTGFIFSISRMRARGRTQDLVSVYRAGYIPLLALSVVTVGVVYRWAEPLSRLLGNGSDAADIGRYLRVMAPFVPVAALQMATLGATRGYETMTPTVLVDRVARLGMQALAVLVAVRLGVGARGVALAWILPLVLTLGWAWGWRRRLDTTTVAGPVAAPTPFRQLARDFWAFTLPRTFASVFRVAVQWLDVLLVAALMSPTAVALYAFATRLLQFGVAIAYALGQVSQPAIGRLYASGDLNQTKGVFGVAATWQILMTWPQYIAIAIFAGPILSVFGNEFTDAATVTVILALSTMVGAAAGPVDMVLLMAGKSMWSFWNTALSLGINLGLNLLLIPKMGINGAAIAWATARIVGNLVPSIQVSSALRLHPFGLRWLLAIVASTVSFGVTGVLVRILALRDTVAIPLYLLGSLGAYIVFLWVWRDRFDLAVLGRGFVAKLRRV